jgi:hypothetical protein
MRTFWDQVVALIEQGDRPHDERPPRLAETEVSAPEVGFRSVALKAQIDDIGHALAHVERLKGLFQNFLSPVGELVVEFEACRGKLDETTAKLAALEQAHRDLAALHAATLADRDQLAAQGLALAESQAALREATADPAAVAGLAQTIENDRRRAAR